MTPARRTLALLVAAAVACLATPLPANAGHAKMLKFPRFSVPARSDREVCMLIKLPRKKAMDVGGSVIVNIGGNESFTSHHFLIWAYTGNDLAGFPPPKEIRNSKACIDFGPGDTNQRILIAGSQTPRFRAQLPKGLAQKIEPATGADGQPEAIGLILNTHWINGSDSPQNASVKVKLLPPKGKVKRYVQPIFEVIANGFLDVPPGQSAKTSWGWTPGGTDFGGGIGGGSVPTGPACVVMLTSHMHKRGTNFAVEITRKSDGSKESLFSTKKYTDPPLELFDGQAPHPQPMLVLPGDRIGYECTHDNGCNCSDGPPDITTTVKMGCEESPGVTPGRSSAEVFLDCLQHKPTCEVGFSGAAKRCATDQDCCDPSGPCTDPAYPTRQFTGKCVPANLVFGYTSEDDMCILPGTYYDAVPNAPPGHECDLSLL